MTTFRVLRTAKSTLTRTFYLDEQVEDASGNVVVNVTRWDGTVVQGPIVAVGPDINHGYSFTFQGSDTLDELNVTWAATVGGDAIILDQDVIQVVGGFLLGLGDIRGIDPKFQGTAGIARYPTQDLVDRRIEVEDEFERIAGCAFVPRYARDVLSGTWRSSLKLRWPYLRRVLSLTVGGQPVAQQTVDSFGQDDLGILRWDAWWPGVEGVGWPYGQGNIVVEYEHGMDRPPSDISRVAKLRIKSLLMTTQSPLPDRAERIATTEIGLVQLAVATRDTTGIPEVDAALARWASPRPGFG